MTKLICLLQIHTYISFRTKTSDCGELLLTFLTFSNQCCVASVCLNQSCRRCSLNQFGKNWSFCRSKLVFDVSVEGQVAPFFVTVIKHQLALSNVDLLIFIYFFIASVSLYCEMCFKADNWHLSLTS